MKKIISKTLTLAAIAVMLSFTNLGGEGFEISLNNKVMIQQYGTAINDVKNIRLSQFSANDQLSIRYHHCGRIGKYRVISIKDKQNKLLKEWQFSDASTPAATMVCNVKDIIALKRGNNAVLKLYYTSSELPKGRLLTTIFVENKSIAINK